MKAETEAGWYTFFIVIAILALVSSFVALGFGYWIPIAIIGAIVILFLASGLVISIYMAILEDVKRSRKRK